jgi:universal bacterial protein YeaZ
MRLLAIDTSTDYLALAVTDGGKAIGRLHKKAPRSHSSLLMPMIDALLKKARLALKKIDVFCIGVGPGSFTGLRIGVTTIKGLAYACAKPIVAVPTFDAIAMNARKITGTICVVLDARKSKVYGCFYKSDGKGIVKRVSSYLLLPVAELLKKAEEYDNLYYLGDYADRIAGAKIATEKWQPKAEAIAAIGLELYGRKKFVSPERLEPMYIYSMECDIKGI